MNASTPTYTFTVQIDLHRGERRVKAASLARAIHRVLTHAQEVDIAGAEVLDSRWGQISVKEQPSLSRSNLLDRLDAETLHRLIDASEGLAVIVKDTMNGWPTKELHTRPDLALAALRTALTEIGVDRSELADVFEDPCEECGGTGHAPGDDSLDCSACVKVITEREHSSERAK